MRIGTHCFNGFVESLNIIDGIILTDDDYELDSIGDIWKWNDVDIQYHAEVYEKAWRDSHAYWSITY